MGTPVQIHIGGDTGIPEKFWEHVRKTLATDDYPIVSLYDDGQEHYADVAEKGVNFQYNSYLDAGGITDKDLLEARKWVKQFPSRFGDELDLLTE